MGGQVPSRRTVLRAAALLGGTAWAGSALAACASPAGTQETEETVTPRADGRTLLAYFSRPGENYYYGGRRDLEVGNTEVLAQIIGRVLGCDLHRIDAAEPYPTGYDATVERNVREQDDDARPRIANPLASIEEYDTVLLGSPIWNVRAPMIMTTFVESYDFTGRTVHPVVTYAVSGLGRTERDYAASCPGARMGLGLAVRGEEVASSGPAVERWRDQLRG